MSSEGPERSAGRRFRHRVGPGSAGLRGGPFGSAAGTAGDEVKHLLLDPPDRPDADAATSASTAPADGGSPERPKRSGGPAERVDAPADGVVSGSARLSSSLMIRSPRMGDRERDLDRFYSVLDKAAPTLLPDCQAVPEASGVYFLF